MRVLSIILGVVVIISVSQSEVSFGQEITKQKPNEEEKKASETTKTPFNPKSPIVKTYRWENSLDVSFLPLFGKNMLDLSSPSFLLGGLWSYKFGTGTYLGLVGFGSIQSMAVSRDDAKLSFTTYGFGPYLGQDLWRTDQFRLVLSLSGGKGYLFVRRTTQPDFQRFFKSEYTFYEPSLAFIFWHTRHYEIGPMLSFRKTTLANKLTARAGEEGSSLASRDVTVADDSDISGPVIGVTVRAVSL